MKSYPYFQVLIWAAILAALHFVGTYLMLYWRIPVFDRLVHVVGGMTLAIAVTGALLAATSVMRPMHVFLLTVAMSLVIGFGWEFFELQAHITSFAQQNYWIDTIADLVSDGVGGMLAGFYFIRSFTEHHE